ncbi:hypothetical protein [Streptomyces sp. NPDC049555]|uniref:hypothetical protein n=1 Tax=Streptomyces sp. NPDC049555 TaxID=3154930 RepID=UPI0034266DA0
MASTDAFGLPARPATVQVVVGDTGRAFQELADAGRTYLKTGDAAALSGLARRIAATGSGPAFGAYVAEHLVGNGAEIYIPADCRKVVADALQALRYGAVGLFEKILTVLEHDTAALRGTLELLGVNLAHNDPYGTRGPLILDLTGTSPASATAGSWAPDPRKIPEWRRKLIGECQSERGLLWMAQTLAEGRYLLCPDLGDASVAAAILCSQGAERLSRAKLYYADDRTCAVASRKAARPRTAPLVGHRVPAPYGMVVFATPVVVAGSAKPIVAASWGRWDSDLRNGPWLVRRDGVTRPLRLADGTRWWITLYTSSTATAGAPLAWETEGLIVEGQTWEEQPPRDPEAAELGEVAVRTVVAVWDLITQERVAKPVTDTEEIPRKPAKVRADRRRGIEDDGAVRLVSIRGRSTPSGERRTAHRADGDARSRIYRHQWMVYEHSRNHCMNPHLHKDDACTHEDITILDFIKGPEDAPFHDRVTSVKP